jgi:hypothetical protein
MLKRSNSAPLTIALRQVDTHCSLFCHAPYPATGIAWAQWKLRTYPT